MQKHDSASQIPLPKAWNHHVRAAVLHVIALAQYSTADTCSWAANSINARVRLKAENERLRQEVALLQEELRIKDARISRTPPQHRPHYKTTERMAILELRAARGWSQKRVANVFLVAAATIASWNKRVQEDEIDSLVQIHEPVDKFPDFVRHVVQRLKVLCPQLGKMKVAQFLARAGLQLSVSTVGRILKEQPVPEPENVVSAVNRHGVNAKYPNHVWHVDLTAIPTAGGLWAPWLPLALPQCWPFCWWVGVVLDQYSRRVMGIAVFAGTPSSLTVRTFLGRVIQEAGISPQHLICDKGRQFWCSGFKFWAKRRRISLRFGAVNRHGSLAVIERFNGTLKREGTRRFHIPIRRTEFFHELKLFIRWYNEHRPHLSRDGSTPHDIYHAAVPASHSPGQDSPPCLEKNEPLNISPNNLTTVPIQLVVTYFAGRRHLPVVTLQRAA